jgi:hypothetical protein
MIQRRLEFAGSKKLKSGQATFELFGPQVTLAIQSAKKFINRSVALSVIATDARCDKISIVVVTLGARQDMLNHMIRRIERR